MEQKVFAVVAVFVRPTEDEPPFPFEDVACNAKPSKDLGRSSRFQTLISKKSIKNVPVNTKLKNNYFWERATAGVILVSVLGFCGLYSRPQLSVPHPAFPLTQDKPSKDPTHLETRIIECTKKFPSAKINFRGEALNFRYFETVGSFEKMVELRKKTAKGGNPWKNRGFCASAVYPRSIPCFANYNRADDLWEVEILIPEKFKEYSRDIKAFLLDRTQLPNSVKLQLDEKCLEDLNFNFPDVGEKIITKNGLYYGEPEVLKKVSLQRQFEFPDATAECVCPVWLQSCERDAYYFFLGNSAFLLSKGNKSDGFWQIQPVLPHFLFAELTVVGAFDEWVEWYQSTKNGEAKKDYDLYRKSFSAYLQRNLLKASASQNNFAAASTQELSTESSRLNPLAKEFTPQQLRQPQQPCLCADGGDGRDHKDGLLCFVPPKLRPPIPFNFTSPPPSIPWAPVPHLAPPFTPLPYYAPDPNQRRF